MKYRTLVKLMVQSFKRKFIYRFIELDFYNYYYYDRQAGNKVGEWMSRLVGRSVLGR